uniref:CbiQ family ECF transporter T component n=1 Tax=Bifidobacterium asteroides TaxID=1684 RepID=UPI0035578B2C
MLILDEPTFGQDRNTWVSMAQLIADLRDQGACIILVTHDRELVQALDARLVEMTPPGAQKAVWPVSESDLQARQKTVAARLTVTPMDQRDEPVKPASRSPYIASINPAFRLIGAFLAALPLLISLDPVSATTALILEFLMLGAAGFTPLRVVRSTWPIFLGAPGSALAIILYGKSGGATYWQWGMIHITQRSLDLALATALRILAIGIPAIITVLGIDATDLADAFSQVLHLPDRFVYGGLAGMRLFTVLKDDWSALTASRRSRGLGDENRFKAFMPQAFALLVLSIRRSTTLATAMEARGFGGSTPRTHARVSQIRPRDTGFLLICLAVPAISLTLAALTGSIAFFGN